MSDGLNLTIKSHGKDQGFTVFTEEGEIKVSLRYCDAASASLNVIAPINCTVLRESLIAQRDDTKTTTSRELLREACDLLVDYVDGHPDDDNTFDFLSKVKDLL